MRRYGPEFQGKDIKTGNRRYGLPFLRCVRRKARGTNMVVLPKDSAMRTFPFFCGLTLKKSPHAYI